MINFKVYDETIIYLVAPANIATGGPEGLHQVAQFLRKKFGDRVFMHYLPSHKEDPVHSNYKKFNIPFKNAIIDHSNNIIIAPEVINCVTSLSNFNQIRTAIWWLSIDNFPISIWIFFSFFSPLYFVV